MNTQAFNLCKTKVQKNKVVILTDSNVYTFSMKINI